MSPATRRFMPHFTPQSDVALAFRTGAILLDQASARAREADARTLKGNASSLRYMAEKNSPYYDFPLSDEAIQLCLQYPDLSFATVYDRELPLWVDRERASAFVLVRVLPTLGRLHRWRARYPARRCGSHA